MRSVTWEDSPIHDGIIRGASDIKIGHRDVGKIRERSIGTLWVVIP